MLNVSPGSLQISHKERLSHPRELLRDFRLRGALNHLSGFYKASCGLLWSLYGTKDRAYIMGEEKVRS